MVRVPTKLAFLSAIPLLLLPTTGHAEWTVGGSGTNQIVGAVAKDLNIRVSAVPGVLAPGQRYRPLVKITNPNSFPVSIIRVRSFMDTNRCYIVGNLPLPRSIPLRQYRTVTIFPTQLNMISTAPQFCSGSAVNLQVRVTAVTPPVSL